MLILLSAFPSWDKESAAMQSSRGFVWLLSLALLGFGVRDAAAADCLNTQQVNWTVADAPLGPAWTANSVGADLLGNNRTFAFSVWRRPCGSDNRYAQVMLSFDRQSGVPNIGMYRVRQNEFDLGIADFVSNKPSVMPSRRILLGGFFLLGDIAGVVEPWDGFGRAFDPRLPFQLIHTPIVNDTTRPNIVLEVPAYHAADYGGVGEPYQIGASTSGTWWNAAQSGHGFVIEALEGDAVSVIWFVYNDDRSQAWIGGAAAAVGNSVTIDAVKPVGAQFPPAFHAGDVRREAWGKLRLTFSDCRNGYVEHQKLGSATWERINLTRLTQPAGSACR